MEVQAGKAVQLGLLHSVKNIYNPTFNHCLYGPPLAAKSWLIMSRLDYCNCATLWAWEVTRLSDQCHESCQLQSTTLQFPIFVIVGLLVIIVTHQVQWAHLHIRRPNTMPGRAATNLRSLRNNSNTLFSLTFCVCWRTVDSHNAFKF